MSKKKEPSKNLIVLLSIIATYVWVMFFVILWLLKSSQNFVNDLGIWVGSLGSIAAFTAVIITTQMQLKAQRENLQEQIDNQNKQQHRPLLYIDVNSIRFEDTVFNLTEVKASIVNSLSHYKSQSLSEAVFSRQCIISLDREKLSCSDKIVQFRILRIPIMNLGEGLATEIQLIDEYSKLGIFGIITLEDCINNGTVRKERYSTLMINKKEEQTIYIPFFYLNTDKQKQNACISIRYSDIHGNIYSQYLKIRIQMEDGERIYVVFLPFENSQDYRVLKRHLSEQCKDMYGS